MQLNQLKSSKYQKSRKRVGRGGKKGTYSGRGMKGQKSRAGKKPRPGFAGGDTPFFKRFPKVRGRGTLLSRQRSRGGKAKLKRGMKLYRLKELSWPSVLNLDDIEKNFNNGEVVSPNALLKKGLIVRIKNRLPKVKILGRGQLTKNIRFEGVKLSKSVQQIMASRKPKILAKPNQAVKKIAKVSPKKKKIKIKKKQAIK